MMRLRGSLVRTLTDFLRDYKKTHTMEDKGKKVGFLNLLKSLRDVYCYLNH